MPRTSPILTSFAAGELSPRIAGRVDLAKYAAGCEVCRNFFPTVQGPAQRRSGFRYVADTASFIEPVRLIPFEVSDDQAYIVELSPRRLRFYTQEALLLAAVTGGDVETNQPVPHQTFDVTSFLSNDSPDSGWVDPLTPGAPPGATGPWRITNAGGLSPPTLDGSNALTSQDGTSTVVVAIDTPYECDMKDIFTLIGVSGAEIDAGRVSLDVSVKAVRITGVPEDEFQLGVYWYDGAGVLLGQAESGVIGTAQGLKDGYDPFPTGAWVDFTRRFAVPPTARKFKGRIIAIRRQATYGYAQLQFYDYRPVTVVDAGSAAAFELVTTYLADELFHIQYAQSADVLYLVHPNHPPAQLVRTSPTSFELTAVEFFDGPYEKPSTEDISVQHLAGNPGDTIVVTASAALFSPTDVGRQFRSHAGIINTSTSGGGPTFWGCGVITVYTSPTQVSVKLVRGVSNTVAPNETRNWRLGAWYTGNYPRAVSFDDQRLVFAADPANPQTFYASVVDDFTNFTPTGDTNRAATNTTPSGGASARVTNEVFADDGFARTLAANDVNVIQWLASLKVLLEGTSKALFQVQASSNVEALAPDNASARRSYARGGSYVQPVIIDEAVVYVSPARRKVYRGAYQLNREAYSVEDISLLSEHLMISGIRQLAWANEGLGLLWAATDGGLLLSAMVETQQESLGWSAHPVGGVSATVESVAVIPAPEGTPSFGAHENRKHDQLWVVVRRLVNGIYRRSVEFLEDDFPDDLGREHAFFVDAGLSYVGPPTETLSGLEHLEGETVQVNGDGSFLGEFTVLLGAIALPRAVSRAHVGLHYETRLRNMRLEIGDPQGSSQGKAKRIDHVTLRFFRTAGGQIASDRELSSYDEIDFDGTPLLGETDPLFTGDVTVAADTGWSTLGQVEVRQPYPLPMTVCAQVHRVEGSARGME